MENPCVSNDVPVNVRHALVSFTYAMERKLREHDDRKGDSWKNCSINFLMGKLKEEHREYRQSGEASELLDIANVCMMLWNRERD